MAVRLNNNRIVRARADGSVELIDDGRYLIPAEGLQVGADCRAYRDSNGNVVLEAATGKRVLVPAEGVQVGADCRAYRDSNGNVVLEAATGKRVLVPAEGVQVGADCRAYRSANGDLTFGDSITYNNRKLDDINIRKLYRIRHETDFLYSTEVNWQGAAINGGASNLVPSVYNTHPGVNTQKSAAAANSGFHYGMPGQSLLCFSLGGSNLFRSIFAVKNTSQVNVQGLVDHISVPVNGLWFDVNGLVATAHTRSAATGHQTNSTTYTLTVDLWYRFEVFYGEDSTAHFKIYECAGQTLVFSADIAADIPGTTIGLFGSFWTTLVAGGASDLIFLDYLGLEILKDIVR
jgi:hypothetical protein